jgi:hypothetical protein
MRANVGNIVSRKCVRFQHPAVLGGEVGRREFQNSTYDVATVATAATLSDVAYGLSQLSQVSQGGNRRRLGPGWRIASYTAMAVHGAPHHVPHAQAEGRPPMAKRFPLSGSGISSLYERVPDSVIQDWLDGAKDDRGEVDQVLVDQIKAYLAGPLKDNKTRTTLAQVVADFRLKPLSPEEEETVRTGIGAAIHQWMLTDRSMPGVMNVKAKLEATAKNLEAAESILSGHQTEFRTEIDIQVVNLITPFLKGRGGASLKTKVAGIEIEMDGDYLGNFCERLRAVVAACEAAAAKCDKLPGKPGRDQFDWYTDFTRVLVFVAEKNGITPAVGTSRKTGAAGGPFVRLAEAFEQVLPPDMRPFASGRGSRLKRSLRALKHR